MWMSFVAMIWTVTSLLVAGVCTICLLQPCWIVHPITFSSFGLCSFCVTLPTSTIHFNPTCEFYGHSMDSGFQLSALPSLAWQAACVLYAGGCVLFCGSAVATVITSCMSEKPYRIKTVRIVAWTQTVSVLMMVTSLFVFPVSLNTESARQMCGRDSRTYHADQCQIGWAYMLAAMGTSLAFFCPLLARYVDLRVCEPIVPMPRSITQMNKQLMDFL